MFYFSFWGCIFSLFRFWYLIYHKVYWLFHSGSLCVYVWMGSSLLFCCFLLEFWILNVFSFFWLCVWECKCFVSVRINIHIYIYIYIYLFIWKKCTYMYICICTGYVHIWVCMCVCMVVRVFFFLCEYSWFIYIYIYIVLSVFFF